MIRLLKSCDITEILCNLSIRLNIMNIILICRSNIKLENHRQCRPHLFTIKYEQYKIFNIYNSRTIILTVRESLNVVPSTICYSWIS